MADTFTVGDLKRQLKIFPDDWELSFGGVLGFNRVKKRGDKLVDIEFNQSVYKNAEGRIVLEDHTFEMRTDEPE